MPDGTAIPLETIFEPECAWETASRKSNRQAVKTMGGFFGKEELENLKSLKRDLVDPVKAFVDEVCSDTVGDAGRFYKAQARRAKRGAEQARERTREKMAAIRREQEEMKKRRRAMMKRAALALALLALFSLLILSAALSSASAWAFF